MWVCRTTARSPTSRMADGEEVERAFEVPVPEGEVRRGDRRDEAVVERPRDPQRPVDPVPPEAERDLVRPEPASVEHPEDLDLAEVWLEQGAVLLDRVLAQVPRVVRSLGPGRGEREAVGGRDVDDGGGRGDPAQQGRGV